MVSFNLNMSTASVACTEENYNVNMMFGATWLLRREQFGESVIGGYLAVRKYCEYMEIRI